MGMGRGIDAERRKVIPYYECMGIGRTTNLRIDASKRCFLSKFCHHFTLHTLR